MKSQGELIFMWMDSTKITESFLPLNFIPRPHTPTTIACYRHGVSRKLASIFRLGVFIITAKGRPSYWFQKYHSWYLRTLYDIYHPVYLEEASTPILIHGNMINCQPHISFKPLLLRIASDSKKLDDRRTHKANFYLCGWTQPKVQSLFSP